MALDSVSPLRQVAVGSAAAVAAVVVLGVVWSVRGGLSGGKASAALGQAGPVPQDAPAPRPEGGEPRFEIRDARCTGSSDGANCDFEVVPAWGRVLRVDMMSSSVSSWTDEQNTDLGTKGEGQYLNEEGVSAAIEKRTGVTLPSFPSTQRSLKATFASRPLRGRVKDFHLKVYEFGESQPLAVPGATLEVYDVKKRPDVTTFSVRHAPPKGFYLETLDLLDAAGQNLAAQAGGGGDLKPDGSVHPVQSYAVRRESGLRKSGPEVLERVTFDYLLWTDREEVEIPFSFTAPVSREVPAR
ncbi:MAG: hypothetical protein FD126_586 [Elusimicrobia bacterium]|nr:MAG: hypothetical protein FD126_586 [Elusimicrobiota bacterium]